MLPSTNQDKKPDGSKRNQEVLVWEVEGLTRDSGQKIIDNGCENIQLEL